MPLLGELARLNPNPQEERKVEAISATSVSWPVKLWAAAVVAGSKTASKMRPRSAWSRMIGVGERSGSGRALTAPDAIEEGLQRLDTAEIDEVR